MKVQQVVYNRMLADFLVDGTAPGEKLPSIKNLAERYKVSETPVRQAVKRLIADKHIRSVRRSGLYLLKKPDALPGQTSQLDYALPFYTPPRKTELNLCLCDGIPKQRKIWDGLVEIFRRGNPMVDVKPHYGCAGRTEGADIVQLGVRELFDFIAAGKAQELPAGAVPEGRFPATSLEPAMRDARLFAVPLNVYLPVLLANRPLLETLGMEVNGFEDFTAACGRFRQAQGRGEIPADFLALASQVNPFQYLYAYSRDCLKDGRLDWGTPAVLEFFERMCSVQRPPAEIGMLSAELSERFMRGKALFLGCYAFFLDGIPDFAAVLPFPHKKGGAVMYGANYHAVSALSPHRAEAAKFLQSLCSEEAAAWVNACGGLHVLSSGPAGDDALAAAERQVFKSSVNCMVCGTGNYDYISQSFFPVIDHLREGLLSPRQAIKLLRESYHETDNRETPS